LIFEQLSEIKHKIIILERMLQRARLFAIRSKSFAMYRLPHINSIFQFSKPNIGMKFTADKKP